MSGKKRVYAAWILVLSTLLLASMVNFVSLLFQAETVVTESGMAEADYIKWVDFSIPSKALNKAMKIDIETYDTPQHVNWIELLAVLGTKYGGDWNGYKAADMDSVTERLKTGETGANIMEGYENFDYFLEAYDAVLSGFLGEFEKDLVCHRTGLILPKESYGLKVFAPIAEGFDFNHFDDFGNSRSYGYKRLHLGNDLHGSIGVPITAVEGGIIEEIGWNQYGGWRIGIRSYDSKRYYYYAHMRKDHPYAPGLEQGVEVQAGDVIGYLGMTGYSREENVNNMKVPHLHFGIQLIFDESQKDGTNQIWIDVYELVEFLKQNRTTVVRIEETKDYMRRYPMYDEHFPRPTGI